MSKSVSRGLTTAGALIANHTEFTKSVMAGVVGAAALLDLNAKPDQMQVCTLSLCLPSTVCPQLFALSYCLP